MPAVIQGFIVTTKPKDITLESFPTVDTIAAGVTASIVYPDLYKGVAISAAILNQDGANACTISLNGSLTFQLAAGGQFNVNDQNIISIRVTAGAAGQTDIVAQVAPTLLTTERARFAFERG
ncbi:MAG TPA: hypothetical protein EYN67_08655 [Flavobacteriales bacterium]|jgi:hypothetical protein|nr:hypothetical protein [Flavobacteriales bacterium]